MSDELNRMVQVFRVHELQLLLASANRNRFGKKPELFDRVKEILRKGPSLSFQNKIRELYQRRFPQQDSMSSRHHSMRSSGHSEGLTYHRGHMNGVQIQRPPTYPSYQNQMFSGISPVNYSMPYSTSSRSMPRAQNVRPIKLPFFDHMATLLPLQLLVPRHGEKQQETCFTFQVDGENDRHIAFNYDKNRTPLPRVELQLRFFMADTHQEQKDDFPLHADVRINDLQVDLPPVIPTNKQGVEPKRPSRPVDITPYYCARRNRPIRMYVRWQQSQERKDKLVKTRMRLPGKVKNCNHIQCFDLDSYLRMNEKRPTWICPVCNRPAHFDDLIIEGYFEEVLKNVERNEGTKGNRIVEIEVFKNGVWKAITEEQKDKEEAAKTASRDKACAYRGESSLCKTVIDECSPTINYGEEKEKEKEKEADVIDLTADEEECRPAASSSATTTNSDRASSVSPWAAGGQRTTPNVNCSRNAESSSTSSSSSESRASPSVIVLDSPPSNPTNTDEYNRRRNPTEIPLTRRRSPPPRGPPKKIFHEDRRVYISDRDHP